MQAVSRRHAVESELNDALEVKTDVDDSDRPRCRRLREGRKAHIVTVYMGLVLPFSTMHAHAFSLRTGLPASASPLRPRHVRAIHFMYLYVCSYIPACT
ncbi:hypothetical protein MTO96_018235 [Rhipicephalus appendiculatus]